MSPTVPTSTYWSVGESPVALSAMAPEPPVGVQAARPPRTTREVDPRRGRDLLRHDGLRGHVAQRHRRRRRHPAAQPAAPLPVQGGPVRRGLRAPAVGLVRRLDAAVAVDEHGWSKVELVLRAGFQYFVDNPAYVRLVRREAIDGGAHLGIDLAAVLRPMFDLAVDYFQREMAAGTFRTPGCRAAPDHRLRRPAQLLLRRPVPGGPAGHRPARPAGPGAAPRARAGLLPRRPRPVGRRASESASDLGADRCGFRNRTRPDPLVGRIAPRFVSRRVSAGRFMCSSCQRHVDAPRIETSSSERRDAGHERASLRASESA